MNATPDGPNEITVCESSSSESSPSSETHFLQLGSVKWDFHLNIIVEKALSEILSPICELYFIIE